MKPKLQRTFSPTPGDIKRSWYVIDAADVPLGRLSTEIAHILRGKNKPTYAPHVDGGDFVIVVNADKVYVSGNKETDKIYYRHSGYPGGIKEQNYESMLAKHPTRPMTLAVTGMLPHNRLGRKLARHLRVYADAEHPHEAQNPQPREITK